MKDFSYRVSFVFAIILHLIILLILLTKFTSKRQKVGLMFTGNIINAVAINEKDLVKKVEKKKLVKKKKKKPTPVAKKKPAVKKVVKKKVAAKKVKTKKTILSEKDKKIKEQKKREEELAKKREKEIERALQEEILAEQKQLSAEREEAQRAAVMGAVDKYGSLIKQAINSRWVKPGGLYDGEFCKYLVNIAPGGMVMDVRLIDSSGNVALDRSARVAILKSSPLPVPEDARLFKEFRMIRLVFGHEGVSGQE